MAERVRIITCYIATVWSNELNKQTVVEVPSYEAGTVAEAKQWARQYGVVMDCKKVFRELKKNNAL